MPAGRPTKYTKELGDKICEGLAEGLPLRTVCEPVGMPDKSTIFRWLREMPEFRDNYNTAKMEGTEALAEELLEIADDSIQVIKSGAEKKSGALAQAQRLRVDTRKWVMSKMLPKKYGDKIDVTSDGKQLPTPIYAGISTEGYDRNQEGIQSS